MFYRYLLTAAYLIAIQYYTKIGGKVAVSLIKYENIKGEDSCAASLVYKVSTHVFCYELTMCNLHNITMKCHSIFPVQEKRH